MEPRAPFLGDDDQVPPDLLAWDAFVTARTAEQRCQAWLALVCSRIPGARAAAVLVESLEAHTYVPMAVWPEVTPDLGRLGAVVQSTLRDRRGVVQAAAEGAAGTHLAYPLLLDQRVAGVVAVESSGSSADVDMALRKIHYGSAWLANLLAGRELEEAIRGKARLGSVLEVTAVALRHGKLQQALFETANELRRQFACSRVAIGLVDDAAVKLVALSEAATFEKNAPLAKAYTHAMEEAYDQGKPVLATIPEPAPSESAPSVSVPSVSVPHPAHATLLSLSGATAVFSHPLFDGARCVGVVLLERTGADFAADEAVWMEAFAALVAPILRQRRLAERSAAGRLLDEGKAVLEKLFGPRHLVWKAAASSLLLLVTLLVVVPIEYRVAAKTVIEGEVQRVAAAPFEGFIAAGHVRAGDVVRQGQILAQLDDRDLRTEQAKWASERDQYDNRLREAMANHDLTAVQVVGAQLRQAKAQLDLVTEKIARAGIAAPFDGVVVSGDLSQQIGAPVEAGKKLFEVAPLQSYRVILQVDEREIRHLRVGQGGRLVITGTAGAPMPLTVAKVTPVATAQDGRNFFRVEASLAGAPAHLRPGMEGVGKIEVGSRRLWWVLTHSFTDWLTLTLWAWLP